MALAEQRESRTADSAFNTQLLRTINAEIDDLVKQEEQDPKNETVKKSLEELRKERSAIRQELRGKSSGSSQAPAASAPQKQTDNSRAKALID